MVFFIIKVQNFAEVDPAFLEKYHDQLTTTWHVINEEAEVNELKFNNSLIFPTITEGWVDLIWNFFFPPNAEIVFSYYGKSICAVASYRELEDPKNFPIFHSRSMDPAETFFFDVAVLDFNLHQPKMVIIIYSI